MKIFMSFFSRWQNWVGLILVLFFVFVAVAAPWLSPNDPKSPGPFMKVGDYYERQPQPPSAQAPLGTLFGGDSVYHAVVWGAREALTFGLLVTTFVTLIGVFIGAISAYFGGFLNNLLMRITDAFLAFPVIAGIILIQQLATITLNNAGIVIQRGFVFFVDSAGNWVELPANAPQFINFLLNLDPVLIAFIFFCWMPYARMMNTLVMDIKQEEFVMASRALGAGHFRLLNRHIIPNALAPIIVMAARDVGALVVLQATFVFIGFGGNSPWGEILVLGRDWIYNPGGIFKFWWVFLPATLAIILFGVGWNLLGDGLNDALNPKTRSQVDRYPTPM